MGKVLTVEFQVLFPSFALLLYEMSHQPHLSSSLPDSDIFVTDKAVVISSSTRTTYFANWHQKTEFPAVYNLLKSLAVCKNGSAARAVDGLSPQEKTHRPHF